MTRQAEALAKAEAPMPGNTANEHKLEMEKDMSFFNELKRRNVVKVGVAYAIVAWLLIQVIDTVLPTFEAPDWVAQTLMFIIFLGFPVTLILAWAFQFTPEGIKTQQQADDANYQSSGTKLNGLIIGVLSLAVVFMAVDNYVLEDNEIVEPVAESLFSAAGDEIVAIADADKSIAVLPFANLSSDPEQEYFSDGLTEELLNKLAQVDDLLVAGRTSSFYYKDRNDDLRVIGETLGVAHLLEGSVRKAGNTVRITAQLIRARDGFHLWSETYDRELEDIFAVQDEIASAVTQALSITMQAGEFSRPGMTTNIEAYDEYLKALEQLYVFTPQSVQQAMEHIETAVALDPEFAMGWVRLSGIYSNTVLFPFGVAEELQARVEQGLERARALEPDLPELKVISATQTMIQGGDFVEAERLLQSAIEETAGNNYLALLRYGVLLEFVGRPQEALPVLQRARRLEPLEIEIAWRLPQVYMDLGRLDVAREEIERGVSLEGLETMMAGLRFLAGLQAADPVETREALSRMPDEQREEFGNNEAMNNRLMAAWEAGDFELANTILTEWVENSQVPVEHVLISQWGPALGAPELALDVRRQRRDFTTIWMPYYSEVRRLPEFRDYMEETGIADYWRSTGNWGDYCRPLEGSDDFECF